MNAENYITMNISAEEALKTRVSDTETLLNYVNLSLKCLQLYPANHITTAEAIDKLWLTLAGYFGSYSRLAFFVTREGLRIDSRPIGQTSVAIQSLAAQLYRLKLEQVLVQASIERHDLVEFLMILCMDPDDVHQAGGVKELLWDRQVKFISVSQASLKLTYEVAHDFDDRNVVTDEEAGLDALSAALLESSSFSDANSRLLKAELSREPVDLAGLFNKLGAEQKGAKRATTLLRSSLPRIDDLIKQELPDEQVFLYRNLAEALLMVEGPLRREIAETLVASGTQSKIRTASRGLIEQLTSDELASILDLALLNNELPQSKIFDFLESMPIKAERFRDLIPFLKSKLSLDDLTARRLLEENAARTRAKNKKSIPVEGANAATIAALAGELTPADLSDLRDEIARMTVIAIERDAVEALAEVLTSEKNLARFTRTAHAIQRVLVDSFASQRLDATIGALRVVEVELGRRHNQPDQCAILKEIIRDAGNPTRVDNMLVRLETDTSIAFESVVEYMTLLGNSGILSLLDMLAQEKRQSRRRLICQILTAGGKIDIAGLGGKVMDHRWYLVRNVVLILGQIGDDASIVYLKKVAGHPDQRVRIEVVKALVNLGPGAIEVLRSMVRDRDTAVGLETIRAISRMKAAGAGDILIDIVKERDLLRRRTDFKIEAITALGALKDQASLPYIKRIAARRALIFKSDQKRLNDAADAALVNLREVTNAR